MYFSTASMVSHRQKQLLFVAHARMIQVMAHSKQAWEVLAEEDKVIADNILELARKGVVEWNILMWLAEYRRNLAKDFDSDEAEVDQIVATILEDTAKELEKVGLELFNAGIRGDPPPAEIGEEECERELKEKLLPLLDDGIDETDILRWLALWRKECSMDDKRGNLCTVDVQFARVLFAGSEKLENAVDEWAESDSFTALEQQDRLLPMEKPAPIRREEVQEMLWSELRNGGASKKKKITS